MKSLIDNLSLKRLRRTLVMICLLGITAMVGSIVIVALLFLRSDIYSFRPKLPAIREMIAKQREATPDIPPFLVTCMRNGETWSSASHWEARCLLGSFGYDRAGVYRRTSRTFFWKASLKWHLSLEELNLLKCALTYGGENESGIHHLADNLFRKSLTQLDQRELAELAQAASSPNRYLRDRELLAIHTDNLLERLNRK